MIYLILAIICSGSIALVFKYSESRDCNRYLVTFINYVTASLISGFVFIKSGLKLPESFNGIIDATISNFNGNITPLGSVGASVFLGIITGVLFLVSFLFYQKSINECGASISGMFSKMGIIIPVIFSIFIWNEMPSVIKWIGIAMSFSSILIININPANIRESDFKPLLILIFVLNGVAEFMNKIFQKYAIVDYKNLFLLIVFFTAAVLSLILLYKYRELGFNRLGFIAGLCAGIPNMFSSFFIIDALKTIEAAVVYPIFSAGSIVFILIMSYLLFKEVLSKKERFAALLTVVSMFIINM